MISRVRSESQHGNLRGSQGRGNPRDETDEVRLERCAKSYQSIDLLADLCPAQAGAKFLVHSVRQYQRHFILVSCQCAEWQPGFSHNSCRQRDAVRRQLQDPIILPVAVEFGFAQNLTCRLGHWDLLVKMVCRFGVVANAPIGILLLQPILKLTVFLFYRHVRA